MLGTDGAQEVPACRICRMEEEPDAPLYHPCKCTGSIRYCHQECLVQWLQHSQKKYCELCQYPFVFHKRYTRDMPQGVLPVWLYLRYAAWRACQALQFAVRLAVVLVCWLLLVPYATRRIWRAYLQTGDWVAEMILSRPVAVLSDEAVPNLAVQPGETRLGALVRWAWAGLTRKWLTGAVLTISLGMVFLSLFFMREQLTQAVHERREPPAEALPDAGHDAAMERLRAAALQAAQARAEQMRAAAVPDIEPGPRPAAPAAADDDDAWTDDEEPEPVQVPAPPMLDEPPIDDDLDERDDDEEWENDEHMAEDLDGMLHAVGLRGTWVELLQNLFILETIVLLIMSTCIMVPYTMGRVLGLRFYDALLLPAKALRVFTDPVFEGLIHSVGRVLSTSFEPAPAPPAPPAEEVSGFVGRAVSVGARLDAVTRGGHPLQRALCVVLGHAYIAGLLQLEASFGHWLHGGSTHSVAKLAQYYLLTLKVFFFSGLDLFVFPVMCGVLMDWCTLPLFAGASLDQLGAQALAMPLSFVFVRWASGTVYMFFFSQLLSAVRTIVRPGVVYFLGDASDPDFNPLRDILQHGTVVQLGKIARSACIYIAFAVCTLGVGMRVLQAVPGLLPLVWQPHTPRTVVPVELLLVHFGLRVALKRARCAHHARRFLRQWWIWTAKSLRMSAYLMGDEQPLERGHYVYASWADWARSWVQPVAAPFVLDGGFMRVPADDQPAGDCAVLIPTDAHGEPVDARARAELDKQLAILAKMKDRAPYTIVYMPPHWRLRLLAVLGLYGVLCVGGVLAALGVPLAIGRVLTTWAHWAPMHDAYTVLLGYLVLAGVAAVAQGAVAVRPAQRTRAAYVADIQALARACGRFAFHLGMFGGLVPMLVGLVLLQYVWPRSDPTAIPTFSVWFAWAAGALLLNTALLLALSIVPDDVPLLWDVYDHMQAGRLWRVPVGPAARHALRPTVAYLLAILAAPYVAAALFLVLTADWQAPIARQQLYVRWGNYTVLGGLAAYALERYVLHRLSDWTHVLRDEMFLESTELVNYGGQAPDALPPDMGVLPDSVVHG
ncbi:RING-type E3 ubiquitin transferase [Malassezia caprae]|uniref:RING-type E3 ubiquitin transferase n=1 Tax=Malassezia caprae TaxID=1381934 RepID=A0AAF0E8Y8_9BASI|nr:RING-type E3 ubiquitin transferase [Malassezia caprae]